MATFVTVIQINANQFDVFKFTSESQSRLYPQTSKKGVLITVFESNKQNDEYCLNLANILTPHPKKETNN